MKSEYNHTNASTAANNKGLSVANGMSDTKNNLLAIEPESDSAVSQETLNAMESLGLVLKKIFLRMQKEGYQMIDGKIVKPNNRERKGKVRNKNPQGNQQW